VVLALALAESVTFVPFEYDFEHSLPQFIPAGLLLTRPLPDLTIFNMTGSNMNVAVQLLFVFSVTTPSEQSASPFQPVNVEPEVGLAIRETTFPEE
jgi:hypothetical protein